MLKNGNVDVDGIKRIGEALQGERVFGAIFERSSQVEEGNDCIWNMANTFVWGLGSVKCG